MLVMSALEFRTPVAFVISIESNDFSIHLSGRTRSASTGRPPPKKDRQCDQPANSGRDDKRYEMSKFVSERSIDRGR